MGSALGFDLNERQRGREPRTERGIRMNQREEVKPDPTIPLPLYYDIFGGDDCLAVASKFRPLPLRPRNAPSHRTEASVSITASASSPQGSTDPCQAVSLLPASRFSAEQQFLRLFNEDTLLAFFEYVKNSDWKYVRDKANLDANGFRNRNGVQFHNDCWSYVIDDSFV